MLTIDKNIEKSLFDAIKVVQPMCDLEVSESTKSLIHYDYLGFDN